MEAIPAGESLIFGPLDHVLAGASLTFDPENFQVYASLRLVAVLYMSMFSLDGPQGRRQRRYYKGQRLPLR